MCLACEEAELFYRFELLRQIADGKMPDGVTEADLRAMDLPLPGEVEVVEDADGKFAARVATRPEQDGSVDLEDFKVAFQQLAPDHREVLTLVGASGCSYEEAAQICGCAVGTIKSRVNRARRKLADLLGLDEEDAPLPSEARRIEDTASV